MIDLQPTRPRAHARICRRPGGENRHTFLPATSPSPSICLTHLHLRKPCEPRLSLHKQLFPRVTASTLPLFSVTSYKSLTPPLMIALQWSLKGTLPAKHTQTTHSLAPSSSPLCLSLSRLSQEPRGPLGYAAPNTKTALGLFELNI